MTTSIEVERPFGGVQHPFLIRLLINKEENILNLFNEKKNAVKHHIYGKIFANEKKKEMPAITISTCFLNFFIVKFLF